MGWTILGSKPARSKRFLSSPKHPYKLWPASYLVGTDVGHSTYTLTWGVQSQL